MGKKRRNRKQNKGQNKKRRDKWSSKKLNEGFLQYYREQNILSAEEWSPFKEILCKDLPLTFRINSCQPEVRERIKNILETDYFNLESCNGQKIEEGSEMVFEKPTPMPWYPNNLGWQCPVPPRCLRKVEGLKDFRTFLMLENDNGGVTRQEAVSMIPPLLLDVKPTSRVLDMCAAPGSKTSQILEALHTGEDGSFIPFPEGFVIANDADSKRARMLTHQLQRFGSGNFLVMNKFGQCVPRIHLGAMPGVDNGFENVKTEGVTFDRILCDVPCSGDGTMRKAPDLWNRWKVYSGNGLHREQLKITRRAIQLLQPGGLLVYSTCSFNPLENEAVVCQLLRENKGTLKLLETEDKLPNLIREPGMSKWKVQDPKTNAFYSTTTCPPSHRSKLHPSTMFPPTPEEAEEFNLHRCIRILPHKQNTGGFFICLLQKAPKATVQASNSRTEEEMDEEERKCAGSRGPPSNDNEPFYSFCNGPRLEHLKKIQEFYGITEDFNVGQLVSRSPDKPRRVYLAPGNICRLVTRGENKKLRIVQAGVKVFAFQKTKDKSVSCGWRITQSGVPFLLPFVTKQKVKISLEMFRKFLEVRLIALNDIAEPECVENLKKEANGAIFLVLDHPKAELINWRFRALAGWKGTAKVQIYVNKDTVKYVKSICSDAALGLSSMGTN